MLLALSSKYQKVIAWFMLLLFYSNAVLAYRNFNKGTSSFSVQGNNSMGFRERLPAKKSTVNDAALNNAEKLVVKHEAEKMLQPAWKSVDMEEGPGPGQPEMSSFKSVSADNMVNLFTGDFSYNIPLGDVGGYPINIFYSSGITMDQEASWVGLGWNINPGTIMRNTRGIPDDFNGEDKITTRFDMRPQITVGVTYSRSKERLGVEKKKNFLSAITPKSVGIFYNNYRGMGLDFNYKPVLNLWKKRPTENTAGTPDKVLAGVDLAATINLNSQNGVNVNPAVELNIYEAKNKKHVLGAASLSASINSRVGLQTISLNGEMSRYKQTTTKKGEPDEYKIEGDIGNASLSFASPSITPSIRVPLTNSSYNLGFTWGKEKEGFLTNSWSLKGYYSKSSIADNDKTQIKPAYGYLYYQKANGNRDAMLDFNRVNEVVYTKNNPVISIPNYTYDVYTISGEGTGGSFRPYRMDIGYMHDQYTQTRERSASIDFEVGGGKIAKFGLNLDYVHTPTTVSDWSSGNLAKNVLNFRDDNGLFQAAYFKNPGERAMVSNAYLNNVADDNLMRLVLDKSMDPSSPAVLPIWQPYNNNMSPKTPLKISWQSAVRPERDKRTQVISYLTAYEAAAVGLDKEIWAYPENVFPNGACNHEGATEVPRYGNSNTGGVDGNAYRKEHHLSEISILQEDGRRYVYGIPVYNTVQKEASFNVVKKVRMQGNDLVPYVDEEKQLVYYDHTKLGKEGDNAKENQDQFSQVDELDPYAHSFLLTGLLSPDYVDLKGDGITDDDLGTAVKFNYTKIISSKGNEFGWRAPYTDENNLAAYNEGLKTADNDQKGHYTYGRRELWYLNSIESKNMIATFTLGNRNDARDVSTENGGRGTEGMKKLERIDIYTKSEFLAKGASAIPVKTIFFEYSYKLCPGTPDNGYTGSEDGMNGKLTLEKIWFTYNGNNKLVKNKYKFNYSNVNPSYDRTANDRWGNYKTSEDNALDHFGDADLKIRNSDYPYALQDKGKADLNASAWNLSEILLPSGGSIKVDYESDDYAFVQDRRAARMFRIKGFSNVANAADNLITNNLYGGGSLQGSADNMYVYIEQPLAHETRSEIESKYLSGINQLYFKIWVKVPADQLGSGYEPVPVYARIADYGVWAGKGFWIKLKEDNGSSPLFHNTFEFFKQYLPSKVFPGSNLAGVTAPLAIAKSIFGMLSSLFDFVFSIKNTTRIKNWCKEVDLKHSFIRLNDPDMKKLGGGYRVKKIEVNDNWDQLVGSRGGMNPPAKATYGQVYDYTTEAVIDGEKVAVSSGVAAYEPIVGAEENPFREALSYDDKLHPLGPTQRNSIEMPLGEVFYPSPFVGYSKVTVRSIHDDPAIKSKPGYTVSEFYTTKDFPVKTDRTELDPDQTHVRFKSDPVLNFLKIDVRERITLSQGFRIQLNDMNGKPKRTSSYAADNTLVTSTESQYRISKISESNYEFNNKVDVLAGPDGKIEKKLIGKDVEVMADMREHKSRTVTFNTDLNIDVNNFGLGFLPVFTIVPPVYYMETQYRSASVLKVVNNYGVIEKVTHFDKGSVVKANDILYDGETGGVLLSSTQNQFNKPIYKFNYPAHWAYRELQGAYKNIDAVFNNVRFQNGKITSPGFDFSLIESGDEIYVEDLGTRPVAQEPGCYESDGNNTQYIPKPVDMDDPEHPFVRRIWAVDMAKDPANPQNLALGQRKFLFIDKDGQLYSGRKVYMRIIRSGHRNLTSATAGGFTSLKDPRTEVPDGNGGIQKLLSTASTIDVISTAATTYKEKWRGENLFRVQQGANVQKKWVPLHRAVLTITDRHLTKQYVNNNDINDVLYKDFENFGYFMTNFKNPDNHPDYPYYYGPDTYRSTVRTWAAFDFSSIPAGSTIKSANLYLSAHDPVASGSNIHVDGLTHTNNDPHVLKAWENASYKFFIGAMQAPWPQNAADPAWDGVLFNHISGNEGVKLSSELQWQGVPWGYTSSSSCNVNVKSLVQMMLNEKYSKNYATAMYIRTAGRADIHDQGAEKRFCFTMACPPGADPSGETVDIVPCTYLDVKYYNCSEEGLSVNPNSTNYAECTVTSEDNFSCVSVYSNSFINPYTTGLLGNWRPDKAYVYYGDRKEKTVNDQAPLRSAGAIDEYIPFWQLAPDLSHLITVSPDAFTVHNNKPPAWSWTSESTQFNSKGFELENRDISGIYNCGIYGYNDGAPVAVVNNSTLKESAYDGFEDYGYEATGCIQPCKPQRHLNIPGINLRITDEQSHTGRYSFKVDHTEGIYSFTQPVAQASAGIEDFGFDIKTNVSTLSGTWVDPSGNGIKGKYMQLQPINGLVGILPAYCSNYLSQDEGFSERIDPGIDLNYKYTGSGGSYNTPMHPPANIGPEFYIAKWEGYIQAPVAGIYELKFLSDDGMKVFADFTGGNNLTEIPGPANYWENHDDDEWFNITTPSMVAGALIHVRIWYYNNKEDARALMAWHKPGTPADAYQAIPQDYLYVTTADADDTYVTGTRTCIMPSRLNVNGNALIDKFSPVAGTKMLFSSWIKIVAGNCTELSYANHGSIWLEFMQADGTLITTAGANPTIMPHGNIIDGWQQFEGVFDIPANAAYVKFVFKAGNGTLYADDIRIHPFNSNMKSLVYDKTNLRLIAELDENNHATFYEYDDDGTLVRVKKETTDGVKTIKETRSAMQKALTNE